MGSGRRALPASDSPVPALLKVESGRGEQIEKPAAHGPFAVRIGNAVLQNTEEQRPPLGFRLSRVFADQRQPFKVDKK